MHVEPLCTMNKANRIKMHRIEFYVKFDPYMPSL